MELVTQTNGIRFEPNCLSLTRRMDLQEGAEFIRGLDAMESGFSWWIADFLNSMEALHGESFSQLIPEGKAHTWIVYKWVGSRVKAGTRRANLSFSHHQAIASLLTERQAIFLQRAEDEKLSVSSLKRLVKGEKGKAPKDSVTRLMECPKCGWEWEEIVNESTKRTGTRSPEVRTGAQSEVE